MQPGGLVLRDLHSTPPPPWWPPAPGWWIVLAVLLLALGVAAWRWQRRRRYRAALLRLFDDGVRVANTPAAQVAAMSELLRRAARRIDADADTLQGDAWLRFLDRGMPTAAFTHGAGSLLRDGGYRREVPMHEVEALRPLARARFIDWMARAR